MDEAAIQHGVELGKWVRQRREAIGLTQEQVWDRMEIERASANWMSKLEVGRVKNLPDFEYLDGLAKALRTTVTDVLRGAGVLPIDVEASVEQAPGSQTIHALVDMVDWTVSPDNRANVEGLLRLILDRQGVSGSASRPEAARQTS